VNDEPTTLIFGAASVVGKALAVRLASREGNVILAGEDEPALREIVASAGLSDANPPTYGVDVRDRRAIESMCSEIIRRFGHITYVFFDSDVSCDGEISQLSLGEWQDVLDRRLTAAFHLCQVVVPYMVQKRHGSIVLGASDVAVVGLYPHVSNVASHAAIYAFAKSLALEFASHGIRVNAIAPGRLETRSSHPTRDCGGSDVDAKDIPMLRLGYPEEVAAVADFLLSDRAPYITGQLIQVNGGRTAW
jgi:NAD(P)-dependent dehydrogenase (short-subunit alcohol dehydrogenase family)